MKDKQRVRIVDIAEELGLSTATVSNVIHGKTKKISDATVKRVLQLLEEKEYIPSMAGILLAQNSSKIIGVIINNHPKYEGHVLEDPFISSAVNDLSAEIDRAGYFMMLKTTDNAAEIPKFGSMWNLMGIVVIGFCEQDYKDLRDRMRIPFVIYDGVFQVPQKLSNIIIDNFDGGYQVGQYLTGLGHKRILYLSDNKIFVDLHRFQGCQRAAQDYGGKTDFLLIPMQKEQRLAFYRQQLSIFKSYTAVFAASDFYAAEFMQFMMENGVKIPEQLSVAGFDDAPICRQIVPSLTTVQQDCRLRAKAALQELEKLNGEAYEGGEIKLPVRLIVRNSTSKCQK